MPRLYHSRYQRVVDLATGDTVGYEATLHAEEDGRELAPAELFATTASADQVLEIDRVGWRTAMEGVGPWLGGCLLFVKATTGRIEPRTLAAQLATSGLDHDRLVVQLTPGVTAGGRIAVRQSAGQCRELGVQVAVVASDSAHVDALDEAPAVVKLARDLLADDAAAAAVASAARRAGSTLLAFGIETETQVQRALWLGCTWGQGYRFGKPRLPS
jgi:EAL domain-containing protein (putative c-di-GMP-specific phosphodiesterase class I)